MLSNYLNWGLNFLQSEFGGSEFVTGGLSRLYIRILLCSKESESSFRCYWELLIFIPPSCLQPCRWTNCLEILVLPSGTGSSRHAQEPSAWPHPLTTKKQNNNNNKKTNQSPFLALHAIADLVSYLQGFLSAECLFLQILNLLIPSWGIHGITNLKLWTKLLKEGPSCYWRLSARPC